MNLTEEFTITSLPLTRWVFPVEDQRQRQRDQEYRKESLERGNEIRSTEWPEVLIFKVSLICIWYQLLSILKTLYQMVCVYFSGVENVINFDCPPSADAYVHRVGRYSAAGTGGRALNRDVLSAGRLGDMSTGLL